MKARTASDHTASDLKAFNELVCEDPAMRAVVDRALRMARVEYPVLITGETGTGKDVLARLIHRHSRRVTNQFVPVNCGAIPEGLIESELFGHKKGAFTGASDKRGLVEEADRGVLFLDEVGELSPAAQTRFLGVVDTGEFRPLGQTALRRADVRVIAATNRDLEAEVRNGRFRQDLFYRMSALSLHIPPLRARAADVEALASLYIEDLSRAAELPRPQLSPEVLAILKRYDWPGNVRELRHVIEYAVALHTGDVVTKDDLPPTLTRSVRQDAEPLPDLNQEDQRLLEELDRCGGNHRLAARALGMSRTTLWRRLRRLRPNDCVTPALLHLVSLFTS